MTINELTVFHDFAWSSTIRISFQISLPCKFCHSTCLVIDWWFILLVVYYPSKIALSKKGFLRDLQDSKISKASTKGWKFPHSNKLGDFEGRFWSLEFPLWYHSPRPDCVTRTIKKLIDLFVTFLMLFISDGLWAWFLRLMVWSELEELRVLIHNIYFILFIHQYIFFNLCWIFIFLSIIYIYTLYIKYAYYPTYDPSSGWLLILLKTSRRCGKNGSCTTSVVSLQGHCKCNCAVELRLVCSAVMTVMNSLVENSLGKLEEL